MLVRKILINNLNDGLKLIKNAGCNESAFLLLAKKGVFKPIIIEKIDNRAANILKQEAIACGADAVVNENVSRFKKGFSDAIILACSRQIEILIKKLAFQPFGLKELSLHLEEILKDITKPEKIFRYKKSKLTFSQTAVMGIINLDPDSFSADGITNADTALKQAAFFEESGAALIDIGAESSRPGVKPIDVKTEIKRLLPVLKHIKKKIKIPVSIDTYKYETAKAALDEGADIINDIFALRKGKDKLAKLISDMKAGLILMHMKGIPSNMQKNPFYKNCVSEVYEFLKERREYALGLGIGKDFISVDPGAGFGKTDKNNIELVKNMEVFSSLGCVTAGVSRKRFVRELSGKNTTSFVAANLMAAYCGASIVRVHDVAETVKALKIIDAVRRI
ncbi:MAG: dihydropteroate synthase [Endomicrobium sp.]|jgi:dihydropteroate synthase|nr:dihydropteroate synthase [Endomicrobium sp.]